MHTTNLSSLIWHLINLIQWYLKSCCGVHCEILAIVAIEVWSSKLRDIVLIHQFLENWIWILTSKRRCIWRKQSLIWLMNFLNSLKICYNWLIVVKEVSIERLNLNLVMNIILGTGIWIFIIHFWHRFMLFTLWSGDTFEIILGWFDVSINLLFLIQLLQFLLLVQLFQKLLLFCKGKLFVNTTSETESTMSISWSSDELFEVWSRRWRCVFGEWGVFALSDVKLNMLLSSFTWTELVDIQFFNFVFEWKGANKGLRRVSDTCYPRFKLLNKWIFDGLVENKGWSFELL